MLRGAVGSALDGEAAVEEVSRSETGGALRLRLRAVFPTGAATEALMLLPPGPGPHPAVLLLHDHGSEFAIGKEKVITPWDDPARAAEAAAWQARLYDGVSLGEALVARGFAVLAADALGWGSRQGNGYAAQQALAANLMQFGLTLAGRHRRRGRAARALAGAASGGGRAPGRRRSASPSAATAPGRRRRSARRWPPGWRRAGWGGSAT